MMLGDYHRLATKVIDFLNQFPPKEAKHVLRQPVVAAMFGTWSKSARASNDFWEPVVTGFNMSSGDARWTLRESLKEAILPSRERALRTPGKQAVDPETMYRWCAHAWAKFRAKKQLRRIRPQSGKIVTF
jgi:hypothetical protein